MDPSIKTINFNQDFSCLSIGTTEDYKVYNCDPFGECFQKGDDGGAGIVEMLFSTSLIAVVGLGDKPSSSTRRLKIINTKRKSIICDLTFPTSVLSVKLNRKRLVVVLFDQIYIYDVSCMKLLHTIETVPNKLATVALSSSDDSVLCFPSASLSANNAPGDPAAQAEFPQAPAASALSAPPAAAAAAAPAVGNRTAPAGSIVVFDALNIQPLNIIQVHKSSLAAVALSRDGFLVATASSRGTIIRVFGVATGTRLFEFRRGSYGRHITSLSFSHDNGLLCCSSSTGTVHIFKLSEEAAAAAAAGVNEPSASTEIEPSSSNEDREERIIPQESSPDQDLDAILNIDKSRAQGGRRSSSLSDYLWSKSSHLAKNVKGQLNNYLPQTVQSMLDPKRDFAFIRLPHYKAVAGADQTTVAGGSTTAPPPTAKDDPVQNQNLNVIVGINSNNNNVMCADNEGNFYVYSIPMDRGGECILLKQFSFKD